MRVVERLKMKKVLAILLAICLIIPLGYMAYAKQSEKKDKAIESEVLSFAKEFADETYKTLKPMDYKDIEEKYLKPGNELFNTEMEVRNAVDHSIVRDFKNNGLEITLFKHEFNNVELKEKYKNLYRVLLDFDEIWETSGNRADSTDPEKSSQGMNRSIILTVENDNGKLYVTDLYGLNDGISFRLNKDMEMIKPLEESLKPSEKLSSKTTTYLNGSEPKGISPVKSDDETEEEPEETIYNSLEELRKAQLQNLANIREGLTASAAMSLDEDCETP